MPQLNGSFWLDEAAQVLESSRPLSHQLQIRDDFQPPLIHLMVFGLLQVSDNEAWLRLGAALLPGLVTLGATVQVGRKYFSDKTAWMAGVLLATSSFHIFYSQELRPYSLPAMFAVLSWWAVAEMTNDSRKPALATVIKFSLWSVLGLYSSYLYPFVLFGQAIYLLTLWRKDLSKLKTAAVSFVVIGLLFAPWIPSFKDQIMAGQQLRQSFAGWEDVVSFDQFKSIALVAGKFIFGVLDLSVNPMYVLSFLFLAVGTVFLLWKVQRQPKNAQLLWMVSCWLILPIVAAWIVSFWIPVVQPKRVLFALPAFYLLIGLLVTQATQLKSQFTKCVGFALFLTLLAINIFSTFAYYTQTKYQRENWREIHQYIDEKYDARKSVVLQAFPNQFASWDWYNDGQFPTVSTGVFTVSDDPESTDRQLIKAVTDYQYILVFDYLRDLTDPKNHIVTDLERYGFQQVDIIPGNAALGMIRVFARTRQIIGYSEY